MEEIIKEFIVRISPLIHAYGALGVFLVSFVEEIVAPMPSSFILLAAGFFLLPSTGSFSQILLDLFLKVVIPGGLGLTIGSMFVYSFAYIGGETIVTKFGKWFGISWNSVEKMKLRLTKSYWDEFAIFSLRTIPIAPQVIISLACGVIHYSVKSFFVTTLLGSMMRAFLLGLLGWYLGESYVTYSENISVFGSWFVYGLIGLSVIFLVYFYLKKMMKNRKINK